MSVQPEVIEHGESSRARELRRNRTRIALVVAVVEGVLVLADVLPWWAVVAAAVAALVAYAGWGREHPRAEIRQVTWILAVSQLVAVLVPAVATLVKWLAVVAIVLIAVAALVVLARDRR